MAESETPWQWESEEDRQMLEDLRQEMGLESTQEVVQALVRQAYYRAHLLCPRCGSAAERINPERAQCRECLSSLRLGAGIIEVLEQRAPDAD